MFFNLKLLLLFTAPLALASPTPIVPDASSEAAPLPELLPRSEYVSYNLTTYSHKLCLGTKGEETYSGYVQAGKTKCLPIAGKSIRLRTVGGGCAVTYNDEKGCGGLFHHKVKTGCHNYGFDSVRIKC